MKRAIIIGATSGIGKEVAQRLLSEGWQIGIAGRRQSALEDFRQIAPEQIKIQSLDVTQEDSAGKLDALIHQLGGMDLFLLSSGIGFQNMDLKMGNRAEYRTYQCRRFHTNGGYRFFLF